MRLGLYAVAFTLLACLMAMGLGVTPRQANAASRTFIVVDRDGDAKWCYQWEWWPGKYLTVCMPLN